MNAHRAFSCSWVIRCRVLVAVICLLGVPALAHAQQKSPTRYLAERELCRAIREHASKDEDFFDTLSNVVFEGEALNECLNSLWKEGIPNVNLSFENVRIKGSFRIDGQFTRRTIESEDELLRVMYGTATPEENTVTEGELTGLFSTPTNLKRWYRGLNREDYPVFASPGRIELRDSTVEGGIIISGAIGLGVSLHKVKVGGSVGLQSSALHEFSCEECSFTGLSAWSLYTDRDLSFLDSSMSDSQLISESVLGSVLVEGPLSSLHIKGTDVGRLGVTSSVHELEIENGAVGTFTAGRKNDERRSVTGRWSLKDLVYERVYIRGLRFEKSFELFRLQPLSAESGVRIEDVAFQENTSFAASVLGPCTVFHRVDALKSLDFADAVFLTSPRLQRTGFAWSEVKASDLRLQPTQLPTWEVWIESTQNCIRGFGVDVSELERPSASLFRLAKWIEEAHGPDAYNAAMYQAHRAGWREARRRGGFGAAIETTKGILWGWTFGYGYSLLRATGTTVVLLLLSSAALAYGGVQINSRKRPRGKLPVEMQLRVPPPVVTGANKLDQPVFEKKRFIPRLAELVEVSVLLLIKVGNGRIALAATRPTLANTVIKLFWLLGFPFLAGLSVTLAATVPGLRDLVSKLL